MVNIPISPPADEGGQSWSILINIDRWSIYISRRRPILINIDQYWSILTAFTRWRRDLYIEHRTTTYLKLKSLSQSVLPVVDVLSDKSCGSKNFMSQNLTFYTSLERSNWVELIGVKFGPNGLFLTELWPVKVLQIGARKWALHSCSGHLRSKIFTASRSFFSCFFD